MQKTSHHHLTSSRRAGIAAVEFALCLPLLMLLVFGSIEAANAIFLRQSMTIVAYETAQIASAVGGTEQEARTRGEEILAAYQIEQGQIAISPPITASTPQGTNITVTVEAPSNANAIGPTWFFQQMTYSRSFIMQRL